MRTKRSVTGKVYHCGNGRRHLHGGGGTYHYNKPPSRKNRLTSDGKAHLTGMYPASAYRRISTDPVRTLPRHVKTVPFTGGRNVIAESLIRAVQTEAIQAGPAASAESHEGQGQE